MPRIFCKFDYVSSDHSMRFYHSHNVAHKIFQKFQCGHWDFPKVSMWPTKFSKSSNVATEIFQKFQCGPQNFPKVPMWPLRFYKSFNVAHKIFQKFQCGHWDFTKVSMFKSLNDAYKTHGELLKNATSYFEQILEAASLETTAVWPLTSHLKNHLSKLNKTCGTLLVKHG